METHQQLNLHSEIQENELTDAAAAIFADSPSHPTEMASSGSGRGGNQIYLWKDVYVYTLLDVVSDYQELLLDKTSKKKKVWGSIAATLNNICGTYFTSDQASVKYRNLVIRCKKYNNVTRRKGERNMQRPKFYDEMNRRLKLVSTSLTMPSVAEVDRSEESGTHGQPTTNDDGDLRSNSTRGSSQCNKQTRSQLPFADTSTLGTDPSASSINNSSRIDIEKENSIQDEDPSKDFMEVLEGEELSEENDRDKRRHHSSYESLIQAFIVRQMKELDEQRRFRERHEQTLESINKSVLALVDHLQNQSKQRNKILTALVQNRMGNSQ